MNADSEAGRRLRQAYAEAWADRLESGDSDEVLRARLRAHRLSEVLDKTAPIHRFIFDLWRRDVPPQRLGRETWKATGRAALHLIATGRALLGAFQSSGSEDEQAMAQQADLEEMPDGKEGVLDNYDRPESESLAFEPAGGAASHLRRYAGLTQGREGWHRPSVWFEMLPEQSRARVLLSSTVIGEAEVPVEVWASMRNLATENLYADGFLDLRLKNDAMETGTLVCYYPAVIPPRSTQGRG